MCLGSLQCINRKPGKNSLLKPRMTSSCPAPVPPEVRVSNLMVGIWGQVVLDFGMLLMVMGQISGMFTELAD